MKNINNCLNCNKPTKNPKFCSRNCSAVHTNKTPKRKRSRKCSKCENLARIYKTKTGKVNYNSTLCQFHYEQTKRESSDYIKNLTILDYTSRDCLKNLHKSSKFAHIRGLNRSWNSDLTKLPCKNCGYSKHVELAHIIAISDFPETTKLSIVNSKENVVQLCPNCHWEFDKGDLTIEQINSNQQALDIYQNQNLP